MKLFWYEKWFGNHICIYCGSSETIKIGLTLGMQNCLYFGCYIIGLDFNV